LAENWQFPSENKGGTPLAENNDLPLVSNDEAFLFVESREAPSVEGEESLDLMTESTPEISPENFDKGLTVFFLFYLRDVLLETEVNFFSFAGAVRQGKIRPHWEPS
jgi:hypothetical protein